jgi:hypothetical protein
MAEFSVAVLMAEFSVAVLAAEFLAVLAAEFLIAQSSPRDGAGPSRLGP